MILYHGTNRRIKNLREQSYLTTQPQDAAVFAEIKGGTVVYQFEVSEEDVYRDEFTPQAEWYLSRKKLQPIRSFSI